MPIRQPSFLSVALSVEVVKSATKIALIVGTVLALINHGNSLINGQLNLERIIQIALTYSVPYCVSTFSAVKAIQRINRV